MMRHDLEDYTNEIARVEASTQAEFTNGAKGDYYFCTGSLRDMTNSAVTVASLRRAVTNYSATLGSHNGGLQNPSVLVTDSGFLPLSASDSFAVSIREVNVPPVLVSRPNQTISVLIALSATNTASEAKIHATLGYLLFSPPSRASINSNGIITWTPSQLQSPSTNTITTVVTNLELFDLVNRN